MKINLCPAQQKAFEMLKRSSSFGRVLVLFGDTGLGKSTVLRAAHGEFGGAFLNMSDFMTAVRGVHPLALEEVFSEMVMAALKDNDTVIIDDFNLLNSVVCCNHSYPRLNFLNAPLMSLTTYAMEANKNLIFANDGGAPEPIHQRAFYAGIEDFKPMLTIEHGTNPCAHQPIIFSRLWTPSAQTRSVTLRPKPWPASNVFPVHTGIRCSMGLE